MIFSKISTIELPLAKFLCKLMRSVPEKDLNLIKFLGMIKQKLLLWQPFLFVYSGVCILLLPQTESFDRFSLDLVKK